MFLKHGILNNIRAWKRSLLFIVLITLIVLILCISLGLAATIRDFFDTCGASYTTIGVLEYMGADYPDETKYDDHIKAFYDTFDFSCIENNPFVKLWDPTAVALGSVDGASFFNTLAPFKENAVIVVRINGYKEQEAAYRGTIVKELYAYENQEGSMIYLNSMGIPLEKGHYYLIHGNFYSGNSSYIYFKLASYTNASAVNAGFNGRIDRMIRDITSDAGGYEIPKNTFFDDIAATYRVVNNSVAVYASKDVSALLPFQQKTLYIEKGREISRQEQAAGTHVCLLSSGLAEKLKLSIGDSITLSVATAGDCSLNESYWAKTGFSFCSGYTVVGLTNSAAGMSNNVYIPAAGDIDLSKNHFAYTLGQATIQNDRADQFLTEISPLLPDRVRLTVYDQGYAAVSKPLNDVLRVAVIISALSGTAGIAILSLFGYLSVYRQRDAGQTMLRLGAGKRNVYAYFLWGSGAVTLIAVLMGMLLSTTLSNRFMTMVNGIVRRSAASDLYYSNSNLSVRKTTELIPKVDIRVFILVGISVFVLALLSCLLFAVFSVSYHSRRKYHSAVHSRTKSQSLHGGAVKYTMLSMRRGGLRTLIPVLVSFCSVLLILQLNGTSRQYQKSLRDFESGYELSGWFTGISGRQISQLSVGGADINNIFRSGYLSGVSVSKSVSCLYNGRSAIGGVKKEIPAMQLPTSPFGWETFYSKLMNGPLVTYTNDLSKTPEFFYSSTVVTEFLKGYDASILSQKLNGIPCCIVSTAIMEEEGVCLGDTIQLLMLSPSEGDVRYTDFYVVGSYEKEGQRDHIYCQLSAYISPVVLFETESEPDTSLLQYTFDSAIFKLKSGLELSKLKTFLYNTGYSEVNRINKNRSFIVIDDSVFLITQKTMSQRLWYMNRIFPSLYVLLGLLAVFSSYILTQHRKKELAVMRSLGASGVTVALSLFLEQSVLCILGVLIGGAAWYFTAGTWNRTGFILVFADAACWMAGTILAITRSAFSPVMAMLHDAD